MDSSHNIGLYRACTDQLKITWTLLRTTVPSIRAFASLAYEMEGVNNRYC